MTRQRLAGRRGFTLIELLVAVAIIALLIAILLPTLSRAKAQARNAVCQSQLREYGRASTYYLADNRDVFVPHRQDHVDSLDGAGYPHWYNLLDYYWLGEFRHPEPNVPLNEQELRIARCPDLEDFRVDGESDWGWQYNQQYVGYGYNGFWLGLYAWRDVPAWLFRNAMSKRWTKVTDVLSPAECIAFGDSSPADYQGGQYSSTLFYPFISDLGEGVSTRHFSTSNSEPSEYQGEVFMYPNGTGNICYVDGHADARRSDQVNDILRWRRLWDHKQRPGGLYRPTEQ